MLASLGKQRRAENIAGPLFVDESCINCDACRWMAPETFSFRGGKSYVYRQPESSEEKRSAFEAVVACPTGSIRLDDSAKEPLMKDVAQTAFPLAVDASLLPNVYWAGYHSPASFGAVPYLIRSRGADGEPFNIMVDAPRFTSKLANRLAALGGLHMMLLTHKDDVSDHNKWKDRFPDLVRVMHASDVKGPDQWPYIDMRGVEQQLKGDGPWELLPGLTAVHTPGHSPGSLCFLADGQLTAGESALFTGDHLAFSGRLGRLDGFANYGDDIQVQAQSIAKVADLPFSWILPGHGRRYHFSSAAERQAEVHGCAQDFAEDPYGRRAPGPVWHQPAAVSS